MFFWNLRGLVEHLKSERNTERESFQYLLGYILLGFIRVGEFSERPAKAAPDTLSIAMMVFVMIVLGFIAFSVLRMFFNANGGNSGKHFLHRMLALNWVLGFRLLVIFVPACILFVAGSITGTLPSTAIMIALLILAFGSAVYMIAATKHYLTVISGSDRSH